MNWEDVIAIEKQKAYYQNLMAFVDNEYQTKTIYPRKENIFKALELTSLEDTKVVLIGQDPYFIKDAAMGLSFSVNDNVKIPKSLNNIFQELHDELGFKIPKSGNLTKWAKSGILLLNRILTVEENKPLSHKNKGWEEFTNNLIKALNQENHKMVFILLGNEAKKIMPLLTNLNHLVLTSSHPSPLGAYHGFFGSGIFKKTIEYLDLDANFWSLE